MQPRSFYPAMLIAFVLPLVQPARAELGGDAPTPESQSNAAGGAAVVRQMQRTALYDVQQTQLPTGTVVREYSVANGKVFAVAWEGPVLPDLQQLLGGYFPQYLEAARSAGAGRGALTIKQSDLVVLSGGHMRAFFGKAYVPQLLPIGVSAGDIQ